MRAKGIVKTAENDEASAGLADVESRSGVYVEWHLVNDNSINVENFAGSIPVGIDR